MATRERAVDRGSTIGRDLVQRLGRELRVARENLALSLRAVGAAVGVSATSVWRIEHGLARNVSVVLLAKLFAVVGHDLTARAFPGGPALRDAASVALLGAFRPRLHPALGWSLEVPLPTPGDQRAWDGMVVGPGWRYGVEAETGPRDSQALARRLALKLRDGGADGVIVLMPETRRVRLFLDAAGPAFASAYPIPARRALERLSAGRDPGGSSIVILRPARRGASLPT